MQLQLYVLLVKRLTCIRRDLKALITQQLCPIGLVALTLLILTLSDPRVGPPLRMRADVYQRSASGGSPQ